MSAPCIYASALEALMPLRPGISFFNVGSGTGYFNSLVNVLTGNDSINEGIDIWLELVTHAQDKCRSLEKTNITFTVGNAFRLCFKEHGRYDRIYLGGLGNSESEDLRYLLEIGGILVGPFQNGQSQLLLKIVRESAAKFSTEVVSDSVNFAKFHGLGRGDKCKLSVLRERPWSWQRDPIYPESFRLVVRVLMRGQARVGEVQVPPDFWLKILAFCRTGWFEPPRVSRVFRAMNFAGRAARCVSRSLSFPFQFETRPHFDNEDESVALLIHERSLSPSGSVRCTPCFPCPWSWCNRASTRS